MVVRYHLFTGGYKDTEFSLKGAAPAIAKALEISAKVDPAKQAEIQEYRKAYVDALNKCPVGRSFKPCADKVNGCRVQTPNNRAAFQACLSKNE